MAPGRGARPLAPERPDSLEEAESDRSLNSIREFGFINPIVVDRHRRVVAGHGRLEAARPLGLTKVPTIAVAHLSEAAVRAYALADNRLPEKAGWSRELLAIELKELTVLRPEIELELDITGFEAVSRMIAPTR